MEGVDGCRAEEVRPSWAVVSDAFSTRVTLTPPLEAGQVGRAFVRHVISSSSPEPRPVFYRHIVQPCDQLTLRVQFDADFMPASIAAFETRGAIGAAVNTVREGEMTADQAMVVLHVTAPVAGHIYGLHWEW